MARAQTGRPPTPRTRGSNEEWRALAREQDVLYNILSVPGKRDAWTAEDFYASGEDDWAEFRSHWQHYTGELSGTCIEIGCGAGRMTRALASDFTRVAAVDVSGDMVERARRVAPDHVELGVVEEPRLPLADGEADAVFSVHVLQHLDDPEDVRAYLAESRRVLRPGGSLMLHIPVLEKPASLRRRARIELRLWRSRRGLRRGKPHSLVRMRLYRLDEVRGLLDELGFEQVELRVFAPRWSGHPHHFWLARSP